MNVKVVTNSILLLTILGLPLILLVSGVMPAILEPALESLEKGRFEENSEHFWEKSIPRQRAMVVILSCFLELVRDKICTTKVILVNNEEGKVAYLCEISEEKIKSDNIRGLVDIGVLIFGTKSDPPVLITIIPAKWSYGRSLICRQGYTVIYHSNPGRGNIPGALFNKAEYCSQIMN